MLLKWQQNEGDIFLALSSTKMAKKKGNMFVTFLVQKKSNILLSLLWYQIGDKEGHHIFLFAVSFS